LGYITNGKFLDQVSDYQLLKKDTVHKCRNVGGRARMNIMTSCDMSDTIMALIVPGGKHNCTALHGESRGQFLKARQWNAEFSTTEKHFPLQLCSSARDGEIQNVETYNSI
jgi:hypothetical protein